MTVYDVALANYQEFFSHRMAELCGQHNLSFFLVEPLWLHEFLDKLQRGDISVGVLIDMASDPYDNTDLYYRLAREVKASGGHVIDDPDRSPLTTHKGKFHEVLRREGIPVPETVIVRREDLPSFRIDDAIRERIGVPFVAKPGWGAGRVGVILDARTEADVVRSADEAPDSDSIMLQQLLTPKTLDGKPAWFRIYHVCGEVIPCWWHPETGAYEMVSPLQRRMFGLVELERIVHKIGRLSGMEFFSTEIALTNDGFITVDYLNDECDLHAQSFHPSGPPDEVVRRIVQVFVQKSLAILRKHPFEEELQDRDRYWQERQHPQATVA